ncbi:MAG: hypothetical protein KGN84_20500 [Acidobacteriota bacterium]|nr:hypothetical protein [Acidobacteriota bacterium]
MRKWLRWPWLVLYGAALVGLAAWYVPQISADRYREPIHRALENALGRKVEIGEVRFQLLPTPGFTVDYVNIGEDPSIGAEPVAYVTTLRARPRLSALFGGPLEFASVDLEDAYINLTRVDHGDNGVQWNFTSLLQPKLLAAFPSVHLISGRINFKFGDTKSIFYLRDTDVDLWPPSRTDAPWTLRVQGEPARTDRVARGFGSFSARGEWYPGKSAITLDVKLEKSELGDMVTLFEGREAGLHGHIWGDAHMAGPIGKVGIAGRLFLDDIHAWNQTPPGGSAWPLAVSGTIDVPGQSIEARATTTGKLSPIDLRYRVTGYLGKPHWGVTALFSQLPIAPVVAIGRNLGWGIPPDMNLDGVAQGVVGYDMPEGTPRMDGDLRIVNSKLSAPGTPPLRLADADLRFAGTTITLAPTTVTNEQNEAATLDGSADVKEETIQASLTTTGMSIASLRQQISVAAAPLLSQATAGKWSGNLRYSNNRSPGTGPWSGDVHLEDADISFEAFAKPLHVKAADASIDGASIVLKRMTVSSGDLEAQGEYRYEAGAVRPHRFRLTAGKVSGASLEALLMPALHRGNFFNYAFNFGRVPEPDWMRSMHADGTLQIASLDLGAAKLDRLKLRVTWDGTGVKLTGVQGVSGKTAIDGAIGIDLSQRQPRYQIEGKLKGVPWRSGAIDAEGTLTTSGTGVDLLANMRGKGSFHGHNLDLAPLDTYQAIDGAFDWSWDARNPKLKLTQLVMRTADSTFQGNAETLDNGQLMLKMSDGTRQIQASGAVLRGDPLKPVTQ